jgi:eukaryotic-like serine/threonine-protein kinase
VSTKTCRPLPKEGKGSGTGNITRFPQDLIEKAVDRLGMLALVSAIAHPLFHYCIRLVIPAEVLRSNPAHTANVVAMWIGIVAGLAVYALTRLGKLSPGLTLDIGLLFEVVGAFSIGLIESHRAFAGHPADTGPGGIGFWITLFVLVVPNTLGKTALAAITSASMGPLTLIVSAYVDNQPPPAPFLFLVEAIPNFFAAAIAIILSRYVYSLGKHVSKAREVGSYKLVELLGRGGMGEVWRAEHQFLARPAAIKLIQPEVLGLNNSKETAAAQRRFEREAQATAMLSSPHTINLYDFGIADNGAFYYVMELLHGLDLQTLVEKYGPVPAERAAHMLSQLCASLEEAHQDGLVHRDIKPANIYTCRYGLEYDFIKVLDFGVVKSRQEAGLHSQSTKVDRSVGTPGFMAPETVLDKEVDSRADIYAIGCVGYWLLTGNLVFQEETLLATMLAHVQKDPIPPSRRTELEIPEELEQLVMWCLEKDPQARPPNAGVIRQRISEFKLAESWTPERAEKWWKLHMPEKNAAGPPIEVAERKLHANAKI